MTTKRWPYIKLANLSLWAPIWRTLTLEKLGGPKCSVNESEINMYICIYIEIYVSSVGPIGNLANLRFWEPRWRILTLADFGGSEC